MYFVGYDLLMGLLNCLLFMEYFDVVIWYVVVVCEGLVVMFVDFDCFK